MNKKSLLSLGTFGASTILSFVTIHIMQLICTNKWVGVSVALSLFLVMFIVLMLITSKAPEKYEKPAQITALTVNAIADGMAISSLFTYLGRYPYVSQSAAAAAVLIGIYALYLLLTYIPFVRRYYVICMVFYVLAVVGLAVAWCATASGQVKGVAVLMLLYMIIFIAFFIPLANSAHNASEHIEKLAYYSFAGLIVALIVLVIISEGDADFSGGGEALSLGNGVNADKKRNPYAYMAYDYAAFTAATQVKDARYGEPTEGHKPLWGLPINNGIILGDTSDSHAKDEPPPKE